MNESRWRVAARVKDTARSRLTKRETASLVLGVGFAAAAVHRRRRAEVRRVGAAVAQLEAAIDESRDAAVISVWLSSQIGAPVPLMAPSGWTASPQLLMTILDVVHESRPALVMELGSGLSSLVIGHTLRNLGGGRLVSLDHDERYASETRRRVDLHGLQDYVDVRYAPLLQVRGAMWYAEDAVSDIDGIDVLIVDGPPASTGRQARFPAAPVLRKRLSPSATLILDDTNRKDEAEITRRWVQEEGFVLSERLVSGKGVAVFRAPQASDRLGAERRPKRG